MTMPKIVFISGDHPRHAQIAVTLAGAGCLAGWIRETREAFVPEPDGALPADLARLFRLHFERRAAAEERAFGHAPTRADGIGPRLDVPLEDLNGPRVHRFLDDCRPELILSYGCHKLTPETLAHAPRAWNTHGGLSPWYRGVITHFWPSYLLEPQMTGITLHETTEAIDGGGILLQTGVEMVAGDGLHDLAARAVDTYARALPGFLARCGRDLPSGLRQRTTGRIWTSAQWRPEHLRPIYETWDDAIVDRVLDGTLTGRVPRLLDALAPTAD
ncbi:formyltransferase family protein [Jannaschia marina]|uniref:formyltransferase family protein n=1 Tax=Jannaschia marina TaxID=2741674 RepID=UPI0015C9A28B|nr:formyltransferase family protein [Jannaschia marina]